MRRLLLVLAAMAIMAAMVAVMAAPAFAAKGGVSNGKGFGAFKKECERELGGTIIRDSAPGGLKSQECQF